MSDIKQIEILGPGCPRCQKTYLVVQQVVEQAGLEVEVKKVDSMDRMIELGVLATPAVVIDGELKLAGQIPKTEMVRKLLGLQG
jgi:small redox-active disulfide protein 2